MPIHSAIQNLVTCIKNGYLAGKHQIDIQNGPMVKEVLGQLIKLGFINLLQYNENKITILLLYKDSSSKREPLIKQIKSISTISKRIYWNYNQLKLVNVPNIVYILSTSKGILQHTEALEYKTGGEVLLYIS